jgi:hypothetical protein
MRGSEDSAMDPAFERMLAREHARLTVARELRRESLAWLRGMRPAIQEARRRGQPDVADRLDSDRRTVVLWLWWTRGRERWLSERLARRGGDGTVQPSRWCGLVSSRKVDGHMQHDSQGPAYEGAARIDRRRRHADDPTESVTLNIPVSLRTELDRVVGEMGWTRSGAIVAAVRGWLARQEDAPGDH